MGKNCSLKPVLENGFTYFCCVYVHMCVCTHVCICTCAYMFVWVWVCVCAYEYMCAWACLCLCKFIHVCTHMYVCICVGIYLCVCICIFVCLWSTCPPAMIGLECMHLYVCVLMCICMYMCVYCMCLCECVCVCTHMCEVQVALLWYAFGGQRSTFCGYFLLSPWIPVNELGFSGLKDPRAWHCYMCLVCSGWLCGVKEHICLWKHSCGCEGNGACEQCSHEVVV